MSKDWYKKLFSDSEIAKVSQAVGEAELETSGEIVPVFVRRSSAVGHVPLVLSLFLLVIVFVVFDIHLLIHDHFSWSSETSSEFAYSLAVFGLVVVIAGASWLLARFLCVQRWLVSQADQRAQVDQRALVEFQLANLSKTSGQTGVLIMLSLLERRAVILADQGIAAKLPPGTWDDIVKKIVGGIKQGKPAEALITAIEECGRLLSQHFPAHKNDQNELPNQLIIKE